MFTFLDCRRPGYPNAILSCISYIYLQELDKDFEPVDTTFMLYGSVNSVIEPLWNEYQQPVNTSDSTDRNTSECEPLSPCSSTESDINAARDQQDTCNSKRQRITAITSIEHDTTADFCTLCQRYTGDTTDPPNSTTCSCECSQPMPFDLEGMKVEHCSAFIKGQQ